MPSNPLLPLQKSINIIFKPKLKALHRAEIDWINKKELVRECFDKFPVDPDKLLRHIDTYYVGLGDISDEGVNYVRPVKKGDA